MTIEEKIQATAPCGLDCFNCVSFERNITDDTREQLAAFFKKDKADVVCKGCRKVKGQCLFVGNCATYACVQERGVDYCHECSNFPCSKLAPASDGAERFPQNIKLYNLCRMKVIGVEGWIANEANSIRELYFAGKFIPGIGPQKK